LARVLVIEDDDDLRFSVVRSLRAAGHDPAEAASLPAARALMDARAFDIVLTDYNLGPDDGVAHVGRMREDGFAGGVVVMTGFGSVELAVRAMKLGADDFLEKPIKLDELKATVERLAADQSARRKLRFYERLERRAVERERPLGRSVPWAQTMSLAERLAGIPLAPKADNSRAPGGVLPTILLLGETGAGKGVIARHVHEAAGDAGAPFVHINCSALPAQLVEGELFGHERGAFTDAREAKEGLFEMADGGTIFLDEIGDLPLEMQTKMLTVLERGIFRRVGGTRERTVRARVIAATNRDLDAAVAGGQFRRDLLYRLNTFVVPIPPLRKRGDDAVLIGRAMLERFRGEFGLPPARFSPAAERVLAEHPWPGNVRELLNAVQRAAMLADEPVIEPEDLGLACGSDSPHAGIVIAGGGLRFDFDRGLHRADDVEKELMVQALEHTRGNVSRAARLIGMQRSSFRYRIQRYDLDALVQEFSGR
jgi:DNA-binding NtrC family response regulator